MATFMVYSDKAGTQEIGQISFTGSLRANSQKVYAKYADAVSIRKREGSKAVGYHYMVECQLEPKE